jgi:hypothetical protein
MLDKPVRFALRSQSGTTLPFGMPLRHRATHARSKSPLGKKPDLLLRPIFDLEFPTVLQYHQRSNLALPLSGYGPSIGLISAMA